MKPIVAFLFFVLAIASSATLALDMYKLASHDNINIIRDTQLLLSLKGLYKGDLNGICNTLTVEAINEFKGRTSHEIGCTQQTLDSLRQSVVEHRATPDTSSTLIEHQNSDVNSPSNEVAAQLKDIENKINNTSSSLQHLSDNFTAHFMNQFNSLLQLVITAFVAGISILIAFSAFLGTMLIKDAVKAAHEEQLKDSKELLDRLHYVRGASIITDILRIVCGHIIGIYKDLPEPWPGSSLHEKGRHRESYISYVNMAASLARYGLSSADRAQNILSKDNEGDKRLNKFMSDDEVKYMTDARAVSINNHLYYSAQKYLITNGTYIRV